MVTPFMFRAVTSRPSGKCRAMDLSLGSVSGSFSTAGSSTVVGDLFSFLERAVLAARQVVGVCRSHPDSSGPLDDKVKPLCAGNERVGLPVELLCLD